MTPHHFKFIRKSRGWSTNQLAAQLGLAPSSGGSHIRAIERGAKTPSGPVIRLMEWIEKGVI